MITRAGDEKSTHKIIFCFSFMLMCWFLLLFSYWCLLRIAYDIKPPIDSNLQKWFFYEYILQKRLSGFQHKTEILRICIYNLHTLQKPNITGFKEIRTNKKHKKWIFFSKSWWMNRNLIKIFASFKEHHFGFNQNWYLLSIEDKGVYLLFSWSLKVVHKSIIRNSL